VTAGTAARIGVNLLWLVPGDVGGSESSTLATLRGLLELAPPDLDALARKGRPVYLLLDVDNAERQWAGLRPQQDYHYLQEHPGLEVVDRRLPYVLFRIKRPSP